LSLSSRLENNNEEDELSVVTVYRELVAEDLEEQLEEVRPVLLACFGFRERFLY
jgi:hypothetical protein